MCGTGSHSPGPGLKRMMGTCEPEEGADMTEGARAGFMVMVGCPGVPRPTTFRESLPPPRE